MKLSKTQSISARDSHAFHKHVNVINISNALAYLTALFLLNQCQVLNVCYTN